MNHIKTITNQDFTPEYTVPDSSDYFIRRAVRAVIVDEAGRIAIMHGVKRHYHKLPGGGIDEGEDNQQAIHREVSEETGCTVHIKAEIGTIVELREDEKLRQESTCYLATKVAQTSQPALTENEQDHGLTIVWANSFAEAAEMIEADPTETEVAHFVKLRDITFLREAEKLCEAT
jgi:8-oxo-dGTP diphosphatase